MSNEYILKPMERGQVTIPKEVRKSLNITPNTFLNLTFDREKITIKPLVREPLPHSQIIKPKLSSGEYLQALNGITGIFWTQKDDKFLKKLEKKEIHW